MARKRKCKHGKRIKGKCPKAPGGARTPRSSIGRLMSTEPLAQRTCARNSLRAIQPPGRPDVRIIVCCPPGAWKPGKGSSGRCAVSLRGHAKKKYRVGT